MLDHPSHLHVPLVDETATTVTSKNPDRIPWSANRPLSWADFQGSPDYSKSKVGALTCSVITYSHYCEKDELVYKIHSEFSKSHSWGKHHCKTDYVLQHEQLHFDITEMFTRKVKKAVGQHTFKCDEVEEFETIIEEVLDEWQDMQIRYDIDTRYSLDEIMQEYWNEYIWEQLEKTKTIK